MFHPLLKFLLKKEYTNCSEAQGSNIKFNVSNLISNFYIGIEVESNNDIINVESR